MIYIHIGLHKTGSSTIQQFAAGNVELLGRHNIVYPGIGRSRAAHHQLKNDVRDENAEGLLGQVVSEIASNPTKDFLISAEGLSTLSPEAVLRFLEPLRPLQPIKIILYVRSAAGLVVSSYNQVTKRSLNMASFDEYFAARMEGREIVHVVNNWGAALGDETLRIRTLEKEALEGGDLLTDLCAAMGMPEGAIKEADPASMERANVGVPWEVAEYVREFSLRAAAMLEGLRPKLRARVEEAKHPQGRVVEAKSVGKRGKPRRATLRLKRLADVVQAALEAEGAGARAQYLTPEQADTLEARYQAQLTEIAARVPDARLEHTPPAPLPPRQFEPGFAHIAPERLAAIHAGLVDEYKLAKMAPDVREIFEAMHGGGPAAG